jgi:predicted O-methyltransferase YrrM|tara:strand:- start:33 stop:992 length:960 start_codon:yes stop_codon:yes gene_type:complete
LDQYKGPTNKFLEISRLKKELEEANDKILEMSKQIQELKDANQANEHLVESISLQVSKQLTKSTESTVKQIESYMAVKDYLSDGSIGLNFHGWPISSEIGLFLLSLIHENQYDCIIEFGSGTSTLMFAQALLNKSAGVALALENSAGSVINDGAEVSAIAEYSPSEHDVPKRIVSFEHHKKYLEETTKLLRRQNVEGIVDLVHAPLVSTTIDGEEHLYYDCAKKIEAIASAFKAGTARFLVLVDGPPQQTGENARSPALHFLLQHLSTHKIDILIDDYKRPAEKRMAERWQTMLDSRALSHSGEEVVSEKGGFLLRVNQ